MIGIEEIDNLRAGLVPVTGGQPRELPEVPEELQGKLAKAAHTITYDKPLIRAVKVAALTYANAQLTEEVNQLRALLGFELIPVYDPLGGKK